MRRERPAANLAGRNNDFTSVGREDAYRGFVQARESDLGDAPGKEGHARAARTLSGKGLPKLVEEEMVIYAREKTLALSQTKETKRRSGASWVLQAGALVQTDDPRREGDAFGIRQNAAIDEIARDAREPRPPILALDPGAGVFDECAVLNARWAGGFASPAIQAQVDVADERVAELETPLVHEQHLADASAGRIRF
jgi:hypothetical protein